MKRKLNTMMKTAVLFTFFLWAGVFDALALTAVLKGPGALRSENVEVELVSELASIQPGQPFWVALRLKMDEKWHTYWKNPGDAGLATTVKWQLPDGFEAGPLIWPYPERFREAHLMTYGYQGEVFLLTKIAAPETLTEGSQETFRAKVTWLECKVSCIPGKAELELTLPVSRQASAKNKKWAKGFKRARERVPSPDGAWRVEAAKKGQSLRLRIYGDQDGTAAIRDAYFFSGQNDLVQYGKKQKLKRRKEMNELLIPLVEDRKISPERLQGVLLLTEEGAVRGSKMAVSLDLPLEN